MTKPYESLKKHMSDGDEYRFSFEDRPKCPHCGFVFDDFLELDIGKEGEHKITCDDCGLDFTVSTHVEITYSTDMLPDEYK